ncbi:MAG: hypothetical protein N3B16_08000, partial [Candidatus Aminicenantes bacterium]|nr:hypothetical protein [Candidatus Aminicenantes bacterium]
MAGISKLIPDIQRAKEAGDEFSQWLEGKYSRLSGPSGIICLHSNPSVAGKNSSPIRRLPLLYNIWDSRAEGLATAMEEIAMQVGLLDSRPRARELVWILLACRCARGRGDLKMHSNEFSLEEAVDFGVKWTPRGWLPKEGRTIWADEEIYLQQ